MDERRKLRRASFNADPDRYLRHRPGYPGGLFDAILDYGGLVPGDRALEIGAGPGQATLPMAERGLVIEVVEYGAQMAELLRHRAEGFSVEVHVGLFEEWSLPGHTFDLVFAGSAFHWLEAVPALKKCADCLRPHGTLALFWNKHTRSAIDQGFFEAVQEVYQTEVPEMTRNFRGLARPEDVDQSFLETIQGVGAFQDAEVRRFSWDKVYDTDSYLELLDTYSDHRTLEVDAKRRLYEGIRNLLDSKFGGEVHRGTTSLLYLARRRA